MFDIIMGILHITLLLVIVTAVYLAVELIREVKDASDYARQQAEADRYRNGDWP